MPSALPRRILMGPGPSEVPSSVLQAMAAPTIGHLDPEYLAIMDQTRQMLRQVFRTQNELTLAVSGTGSAGMEACVVNLIEPGDPMIVCVAGVFGQRMTDVATRCGARVATVEVPWGQTIQPEMVQKALQAQGGTKVVGIVHAETSTGAEQEIREISRITHEAGALLLVDVVTSLGGVDVRIDDWNIDAAYSATQKCLSCPPGLSPVTFSPAAAAVMASRKTKVQSWYLDMSMLQRYWGQQRAYHHTAPINMTYGLHEALRLILEEGLEPRIRRHALHHRALRAGLERLGLTYVPARSLTTLNAVRLREGMDEAAIRRRLLQEYDIEIGAGLGPLAGKAWRVGLMGASSCRDNVRLLLEALEKFLPAPADGAVAAADAIYALETVPGTVSN